MLSYVTWMDSLRTTALKIPEGAGCSGAIVVNPVTPHDGDPAPAARQGTSDVLYVGGNMMQSFEFVLNGSTVRWKGSIVGSRLWKCRGKKSAFDLVALKLPSAERMDDIDSVSEPLRANEVQVRCMANSNRRSSPLLHPYLVFSRSLQRSASSLTLINIPLQHLSPQDQLQYHHHASQRNSFRIHT